MTSASTPSAGSLHGIDRDALVRVVEPIVRAHGAELVDLELKSDRGGWVLRVLVEKAGSAASRLSTRDAAVDLELCADVSRDLSPALDVVDLIPHAYSLEVGSPGVERPLRGAADFARFEGQKAKIKLRDPVATAAGAPAQRVVVGVLQGVEGDAGQERVRIAEGARTHDIPIGSIDRARLVFEIVKHGKHERGGGPQRKHSGPEPRQKKQQH
jgi:ribosome maturation factor RimP